MFEGKKGREQGVEIMKGKRRQEGGIKGRDEGNFRRRKEE